MASIGALGIPQAHNPKGDLSWGIGSLLVISSFIYYASVGPLTNTICAEVPSAMLRSKSIALARGAYIITTIIAGVLTPYQLNEGAWNWGAKTAFFWLGGCVISFTFAYFCLPETKDRTTAETDYRMCCRSAASEPWGIIGTGMKSHVSPLRRVASATLYSVHRALERVLLIQLTTQRVELCVFVSATMKSLLPLLFNPFAPDLDRRSRNTRMTMSCHLPCIG